MPTTPNLMDYTNTSSLQSGIGTAASDLVTSGQQTKNQGLNTFQPLISHFMKILSGDSTAIDAELAPEISGTKDSYQAARDAVTNFTPRGGGLASSMSANRTSEASDISKIKSTARTSAATSLAGIGQSLLTTGAQEEGAGIQDFGKLLDAAMKQDENSASLWGKIGGTIGAVVGSVLFPPAAPALLGGAVAAWGGGSGGGGGSSAAKPSTAVGDNIAD